MVSAHSLPVSTDARSRSARYASADTTRKGREILESLWTREASTPGSIKPGATNITIFSTIVAAVAGLATAFTDLVETIFPNVDGAEADWLKLWLLIAILAAGAAIVVADLLARSRVTAAAERSSHVYAAPKGMKAKVVGESDPVPVNLIKLHGDGNGTTELQVEVGDKREWRVLDEHQISLD